jgi:hypothetical protein
MLGGTISNEAQTRIVPSVILDEDSANNPVSFPIGFSLFEMGAVCLFSSGPRLDMRIADTNLAVVTQGGKYQVVGRREKSRNSTTHVSSGVPDERFTYV